MQRKTSRVLSVLLALCMVLALLPAAALADDADFVIEDGVLMAYQGSDSSVTIPNNVIAIGDEAFGNCSDLTSVTIPDSVAAIGNIAFGDCINLTGVTIPNSVTTIGDTAFGGCRSLTGVTIPGSVTALGDMVFVGCTGLTDLYYGGSESQWNEICPDDSYLKDLGTTIHYNSAGSDATSDPAADNEPTEDTEPSTDSAPSTSGGISVTVSGQAVEWTDAAPFIDENDRTMVPLRAVADAMELDVNWDAEAREASFTDGSRTIIFPIDSTSARTSDGETVQMDTAAVIVSDRTYAPIRYLAEFFGHEVGWDADTQTVIIN